jgi:hypothetical protein
MILQILPVLDGLSPRSARATLGPASMPLFSDMPTRTTHPNHRLSMRVEPPLALHFVYPRELVGLAVDLRKTAELGRDVPGADEDAARTTNGLPHRKFMLHGRPRGGGWFRG